MSADTKQADVLDAQINAISDTRSNITGLIEKVARIQAELATSGLTERSDALTAPFASLSEAAEKLESIEQDMEMERNRIRNEA